MADYTKKDYDVVIIGAGGAGLRAAISASGKSLKVAIICKSLLGKAHTVMAEGGMAAALKNVDSDDSWEMHFRDTMKGGKFLNNYRMAQIHAQEAPERVRELEKMGAVFDRTKDGYIHQRPFGGHSYARLAHVGDRTGLEMIRTLQDAVVHQEVDIFMEYTVFKLIRENNEIKGLLAYDRNKGDFYFFRAKSVILATGGCARCFAVQTNSWEGTGDGHALALNAGAELIDMEFLQFHPTGMVWPLSVKGILVTEGVRGEGGILLNKERKRFMFNYIPDAFKNDVADNEEEADRWVKGDRVNNRKPPELLTRDVVARAILAEIKAGRSSPHGGVFLDIAAKKSPGYIKKSLPSMYHQFKQLAGVDITRDPMEVGPTAHYIMGGVKVEAETCESTVRGLYAAGEVAAGLHGANRLGGNSLTDLLVFGKRAGEAAAERSKNIKNWPEVPNGIIENSIAEVMMPRKNHHAESFKGENPFELQNELKQIMADHCGIIRNEDEIERGIGKIMEIKKRAKNARAPEGSDLNTAWHAAIDLKSLITVSLALAKAALMRKESRGAHTRDDFPHYDEEWGQKNIILKKNGEELEVETRLLPKIPHDLAEVIKSLN